MSSAGVLAPGLEEMLLGVLDAAIATADADFGNVQLLDDAGRLRIAAHRGFPGWWVDYWNIKAGQGHGACGAALQQAARVVVEDMRQDPVFRDPDDLDSMEKIGARAVQSTPIVSHSGDILGMFSTHYKRPYRPDAKTLGVLDVLAQNAATGIEWSRIEEKQQELAGRSRPVYLNAPVGIVEVDPVTLTVHHANPAFCEMLGYTMQEIVGLHILSDLTHPEHRRADRAKLKGMLQREVDHLRTVKRYLHKNGGVVWGEVNVTHVPDAHGGSGFNIAVVRDLTEQRRNEELQREQLQQIFQLQRLQTANELASVLAHEIKQPLTAIPMYAALAKQVLAEGTAPDREELGELLDRINQIALQAGEIIQRMRHFYARGAVDPAPMDLNVVIHSVEAVLEPVARRANIRLRTDLCADLPNVMGVEVHIEQVLLNLVRNAFDAIGGGGAGHGEVTVRTQCVDRMAHVTVSDSGPGIDAEQAKRLFAVMSSTKADGLGMGLRISRSLVVAHKGRLWAEPHVPGGVFHFELPLA